MTCSLQTFNFIHLSPSPSLYKGHKLWILLKTHFSLVSSLNYMVTFTHVVFLQMMGKSKDVKQDIVWNHYPGNPNMQKIQEVQGVLSPRLVILGCFSHQTSIPQPAIHYPTQPSTAARFYMCRANLLLYLPVFFF